MSKKRNRAKLNKALTHKEYKIIQMSDGHYCPICMKRAGSWFYDCSPSNLYMKHRHGNGRGIENHKFRSYKTWKHNRKTQWKEKRK